MINSNIHMIGRNFFIKISGKKNNSIYNTNQVNNLKNKGGNVINHSLWTVVNLMAPSPQKSNFMAGAMPPIENKGNDNVANDGAWNDAHSAKIKRMESI